jgi:hypothetical protein
VKCKWAMRPILDGYFAGASGGGAGGRPADAWHVPGSERVF